MPRATRAIPSPFTLVQGCTARALVVTALSVAAPLPAQEVLTLQGAMDLAEQDATELRIARAEIAPAQAELGEARALLWHNPELSAEARHRALGDTGEVTAYRYDGAIGLSQTFEIAGQPGARRAAAGSTLEATENDLEQKRREVRREAAKRFYEVLRLGEHLDEDQTASGLLHQAAAAVAKRVEAGEDTRLDGNLALVEVERADAQVAQTRNDWLQARAALATTLQLPAATLPQASGTLELAELPYQLADLLTSSTGQPSLRAAAAREQAAQSRLDLERAARFPDVTLGLSHSTERAFEGTDRITTLSVSVPLPLFHHNGAAISRADADLAQKQVERQAAEREAEASVRVLWQGLGELRERARRLEQVALPALRDNQRLSLAALRAGEINVAQFLLARRQAVETQREVTDARAQALLAQLDLEGAAGWASPARRAGGAR